MLSWAGGAGCWAGGLARRRTRGGAGLGRRSREPQRPAVAFVNPPAACETLEAPRAVQRRRRDLRWPTLICAHLRVFHDLPPAGPTPPAINNQAARSTTTRSRAVQPSSAHAGDPSLLLSSVYIWHGSLRRRVVLGLAGDDGYRTVLGWAGGAGCWPGAGLGRRPREPQRPAVAFAWPSAARWTCEAARAVQRRRRASAGRLSSVHICVCFMTYPPPALVLTPATTS